MALIGNQAETVGQVLERNAAAAHNGLLFGRWLAMWDGPPDAPEPASPSLVDPLNAFVMRFNRRGQAPANRARLAEWHRRLIAATAPWVAKGAEYRVQWRFATGLGADHPTGNGFSFDDTIGVPYVTGSAAKGLCRRAARLSDAADDLIERLLGPDEATGAHQCGDLVFYDALPTEWPKLAVDIVNCHHPRYYGDLSHWDPRHPNRPQPRPTETEDPNPVFFLAVEEGARFRFCVGSRSRAPAAVDQGLEWLRYGLDVLGAGAKTAVGYGAMEPAA